MLTPTVLFRATAAALTTVLLSASLVATGLIVGPAPEAAAAESGGEISTITVDAKAMRTGSNSVDGLAGVMFGLFESNESYNTDSPGEKVDDFPSECTTDATGQCSISVPQTGWDESNYEERFWVKQLSAPSGYFLNTDFVTGTGNNSSPFAPTPQVFRTQELTNDDVDIPDDASMPNNSMVGPPVDDETDTDDRWVSGNSFAVSKDNNRFDPTCEPGVRIAIVLDLSLSMNGGGLAGAKAAAKKFIGSLVDTGAEAALFTFSTNAPADDDNDDGRNWPAMVVTSGNLDTFEDRIDDYDTHGYTNWDRGLWQVADESGAYDLAVVLTDGNPTVYGNAGTSTWTNLQKMQEAVYSANAIKGEDTQVFAFGVGDGVSGAPNNLIAVSGPIKWDGVSGATVATSDYFQTTDWDKVGAGLKSLAQSVTCVVPIEVTKTEILADGTSQDGSGWEFTATESGDGELSDLSTDTTDANGVVDWELTFDDELHSSTVTIDEDLASKPGNWSVTSVSCTNKGVDFDVPQSLPIILEGLGVGDEIKCAVTNQDAPAASITVDKKWVIDGADPIDHGEQPDGLGAQLVVDNENETWGEELTGYTVGDEVELDETVTDTNEYCAIVDQKLTSPSDQALAYDATLAAGDNSFTITNYVECGAKLILTKIVTGNTGAGGTADPDDWTLTASAVGQTSISGTSGVNGDVAPGVEYSLTETEGPVGYDHTSTECRVGDSGAWIPVAGKVTVEAQTTMECRFTNDAIAPQLQLRKVVAGVVVSTDNWSLTAKSGDNTVVSGNGLAPYADVVAGVEYTLAENAIDPFDDSEFTASDWVCTVTSGEGFGEPVNVVDGNRLTLSLDQKVECVITNTVNQPEAAFTKTAGSATANADGSWDVTFTLTVTNPSALVGLTYDLTDTPVLPAGVTGDGATVTLDGNPVGDFSGWTGGALAIADNAVIAADGGSHVYTVTLTVIPATSVHSDALDCTEDGGIDNDATMTPAIGSPINDGACVSIDLPAVSVSKTVDSASQNQDGTWTIVYDVDVSASGTGVALYDLSDAPQFGVGVTISSASATGPAQAADWNGAGVTSLATAEPIMAGETDNYIVTVVADIAKGVVGTTAADCALGEQETGTGFLNSATLTANGDSTTVTDCAVPAQPTVQKSAGSAISNGDGTWDITYSITVTNPTEDYDLYYDLSDAPELPAGVDPVSATVTGEADLTIDPWTGGAITLADDKVIDRKQADDTSSHAYTVTLTVIVGTDADPADLECGNGGGILNTATLTSGNEVAEDDACVPVTTADVSHTKDVISVDQNADGSWTIVYDVTVTATGTGSALYDLSDVPALGAGITASAAWTASGPSTEAASWNGAGTTTLASDEPITAGDSHIYTITVHADVAAGVTGTTAADCLLGDGEDGTGFLNAATLTANGESTVADDCAMPVVPEFEKNFTSAEQNDDATWNVGFTLLVSNPSTSSGLYYSLSDIPGFATGATIESITVAVDGGTASAWNGTDALATDRLLPAGGTDTYALVFTVTVPVGIDSDVLDCTGEPGNGFFNAATLTTGNDTLSDEDCGPVEEGVLPLLDKTVTSVKQLAGGVWEISYDIEVSTPETNTLNARYDLSDELRFGDGIQVTGQSITAPAGVTANPAWTGAGANTNVVTDQLLPAGTTHHYTVTVTATIDEGVTGTSAADCVLDGEETRTGFLNSVVLTSGSLTREDSACDLPASPEITKELVGSPVNGPDNTVTVTYLVTAINESGVELNYDLTDSIDFAEGVTITGQSVTGPAGVTTRADWDGDTQPIVVEDQSLPANESHEYTVTVSAKLTLFIDPLTLECVDGTSGSGYFNGAVLTSGNDDFSDDACAPIPETDLPTLPLPPDPPTLALTGASVLGVSSLALLLLALGTAFVARRARCARQV